MLQVRESTPSDASAIVRICQTALSVPAGSPMFDPRLMHWKYWAPWPGSSIARSYVATRDGEVVAHIGLMPLVVDDSSERAVLVHPMDWAAKAEVLGAGVVLLRRLSDIGHGVLVLGGSEQTRRMLGYLGYRSLPSVGRFAAATIGEPPPNRELTRLDTSERPEHDRQDPFAAMLTFARSKALFEHWSRCPTITVTHHDLQSEGGMPARLVLAQVPGQARILDVWCEHADPAEWASVFLHARVLARSAGFSEVVALASTKLERSALVAAGFSSRGELPLFAHGWDAQRQHARIQLLDGDCGFLHHGQPERWME